MLCSSLGPLAAAHTDPGRRLHVQAAIVPEACVQQKSCTPRDVAADPGQPAAGSTAQGSQGAARPSGAAADPRRRRRRPQQSPRTFFLLNALPASAYRLRRRHHRQAHSPDSRSLTGRPQRRQGTAARRSQRARRLLRAHLSPTVASGRTSPCVGGRRARPPDIGLARRDCDAATPATGAPNINRAVAQPRA